MSFLTDIVDIGKSVVNFFNGNSIASTVVKLVALRQISKSINSSIKANDPAGSANIDGGVRLQIDPGTNNKIPVLYGSAFFGGIITDAAMTNGNKTMYYCLTLSEKTGTKLSDGQPTNYVFKDVYWNDNRIVFKSTGTNAGILADYMVDRSGVVDVSIKDQVSVYCFAGNSTSPVVPDNYTNTNLTTATSIMPTWSTGTYTMSDLLFALVKVDYNRDKNITGIGNMTFHIESDMRKPGDVLYDYMTNERYGAGIPAAEIKST
jgi:hypothetical protein